MRLIGHISPSAESSTQICFQRGFINRFDLHQQDLDDDDDDDDEDDDDDVVVVVPGDFDARKENTPSCAHGLAHRDSGVFFHDRTRAR